LSDLPPLPEAPLGRYRHYKGGEYEVVGVARHSETREPMVLYRPLYNDSGLWVRPYAMFFGTIEVEGRMQPRFAPVRDPDGDAPRAARPADRRVAVRPVRPEDHAQWRPLWDGYNAFYGRIGETALPETITASTWERFFDAAEPVRALVAVEEGGRIVGIAHYLFHRSTSRLGDVCYLQDLFTAPEMRGRGIGRRLIEAVRDAASEAGCSRVYWQTQAGNAAGRALYDRVARHHGFIVYSLEIRKDPR
jgi:GNAT superfamily N-acetyltransferase